MECQVCHRKLVCDFEYRGGEGAYVEESRYFCEQGHYVEEFHYGYTGITVFDKVFTFSYTTKEKALHSINKNMQSFIKWKLDQQDKCLHDFNVSKLVHVTCSRCGYYVPKSVLLALVSKIFASAPAVPYRRGD